MKEALFIIEEPYVSELMLKTMKKNNFPVLKNEVAQRASADICGLNFVDGRGFDKVYSNSENSIEWVWNNYKDTELAKYINISKNKYEMRKVLKEVYPDFFFQEVSLEEIENVDTKNLPQKFIIKPSVGFLSMGVHKVTSSSEWAGTVQTIKKEIIDFKKNFPEAVLNSSKFIIEEVLEGEEFAIDVYFDDYGHSVIMNIFAHPFVSEDDVSDRAYISSKEIIENNLNNFENVLNNIGQKIGFKNFPTHIEVIKKASGQVVPIEINPMRFAGWCTTDLAYYAYGINIYEYFVHNKKPDWENILKDKEGKIYYFAMAETPTDIDKNRITFDYEALKKCFSKILDFRKIDYINKPVFAVIFGETNGKDEINKILELNMHDFIK
ncbi:MAG: ATP-grasp domain-containing protein [bacterium]|nr:ATP-grasp domain-containing protein [bacterium]